MQPHTESASTRATTIGVSVGIGAVLIVVISEFSYRALLLRTALSTFEYEQQDGELELCKQ